MSMEATSSGATATQRRAFHYRDLEAAGARFQTVGDAAVAWGYGADGETDIARRLGLADLSPLPRTGFKGRDTAAWLDAQGIKVGEASNMAYPCGKASLTARLSPGEMLLLGSRDGTDDLTAKLDAAWSDTGGLCFPVPRRDASFWFNITGDKACAMFAKICGIDLRPKVFEMHAIAQTSVARTNAIIIRDDIGGTPAFHMLGDSASAGYMWGCLLDAMGEFDGGPVGLEAVLGLTKD